MGLIRNMIIFGVALFIVTLNGKLFSFFPFLVGVVVVFVGVMIAILPFKNIVVPSLGIIAFFVVNEIIEPSTGLFDSFNVAFVVVGIGAVIALNILYFVLQRVPGVGGVLPE